MEHFALFVIMRPIIFLSAIGSDVKLIVVCNLLKSLDHLQIVETDWLVIKALHNTNHFIEMNYYTHIRCGRGKFQKWSKFCKSWPACLWFYHFFCLLPNSSRFLLCFVLFLFLFVRFTRFSSMGFQHDSTDFGQFTCMSNIDGIKWCQV